MKKISAHGGSYTCAEDIEQKPIEKKSAFVAVVGRPSAGKSTLINTFCGAKVSIVSPVPQTTRNNIRGIVNSGRGQIIFVDTPGRHKSDKKLNKHLIGNADRALLDSDLILYLIDSSRQCGEEEIECAQSLPKNMLGTKVIVAINKIDNNNSNCENVQKFLCERLPELNADHIFKISALKGIGTKDLLDRIYELSPEGPQYYDSDCYTDQEVNFRIAEIIREKATERLREELPHAIYVEITDCGFKQVKPPTSSSSTKSALPASSERASIEAVPLTSGKQTVIPETLIVRACIRCERESQKGMIVGKGGTMIRSIRLAALEDLKKIFDWKIELEIRVKTDRDWRSDDGVLKKIL
ncbi:MAG: GTPase Era [Termitinemataceae bacterium]|nr:MAG: GTPase Era [Termitinemataceae bacterium]